MEIPKEQILEFLRERGESGKASQAEQELPEQVDTERDRGVLDSLGIDAGELVRTLGDRLPGGLGDKIPGF